MANRQPSDPGLFEYGLILVGLVIAALVALFALGPKITELVRSWGLS